MELCFVNKIGATEWTIDLSEELEHPKITQEEIKKLLEENPLLETLTIFVNPNLTHSWKPDFKALDKEFRASSIGMPYLRCKPKLEIRYTRRYAAMKAAIATVKNSNK